MTWEPHLEILDNAAWIQIYVPLYRQVWRHAIPQSKSEQKPAPYSRNARGNELIKISFLKIALIKRRRIVVVH